MGAWYLLPPYRSPPISFIDFSLGLEWVMEGEEGGEIN